MLKFNFIAIANFLLLVGTIRFCSSQLIFRKGAPHVKLNQGIYAGTVKNSRNETRHYYKFLGLRYANPLKRFQDPEPLTIGFKNELITAIKAAPRCIQQFGPEINGVEDCLYLNVFLPMKEPPNKDGYPVMVFIHGGGFTSLSGNDFDPYYFMDEDVIVVTFNYRLGVFGFLSTEDEVVPGNLGLKDQVLALKWVQENIKKFGGNEKQVTIVGSSAGAASVHYHLLSPLSKGLFHAAIVQSGSTSAFWAFSNKPLETTKELAEILECPKESSTALVKCLESKPAEEIILAQTKLLKWFKDPMVPFGPTVEKPGSSAFLADHPDNIMNNREFFRVPLIIGITQDEGLSIHSAGIINNPKLLSELDTNFQNIAPITFNYKDWFPEERLTEVTEEIRKFYFGDKSIDLNTFQNLTNLYSDANFNYGVWKLALSYATENPVYPYLISYLDESSASLTKILTGDDKKYGVAHGDELQYLFKFAFFEAEVPKGSEAETFSKRLVKLWASFVQHRKPTETWGSAAKWPPISKAQLNGDQKVKWYQLDKDTKIIEEPFIDRKKFWDKLFKKYSKPTESHNEKEEL